MRIETIKSEQRGRVIYRLMDNKDEEVRSVTEFLTFLRVKNYSPNTLKNYAYDLKYLFEYLDALEKKYDSITPRGLVEFLDYVKNIGRRQDTYKRHVCPLSTNTIKRILASISSFYSWHELSSYIPNETNPQIRSIGNKTYPTSPSYKSFLCFAQKQNQIKSNLIRIKQIRNVPRPLDEDNFGLLLQELNSSRDKAILFLGLQGGMRIGEILGLCLEDINFRKKEITIRFRENPNQVRVKGMRERIIFIEEPESLTCLNNYILHERPESDSPYLFLATKGKTRGQPLTYQGIYTVFDHHCQKLNFKKKFTFHSLRHAHATKMYEGGMGLLSLQKRLGHASPQTTQIYAQVSDKKLKEDYLLAFNNKEGITNEKANYKKRCKKI